MYSGSVAETGTHSCGFAAAIASFQSTSTWGVSAAFAIGRWKIRQRSGLWRASRIASSSSGLYSMTFLTSMPQEAEMMTFGSASLMRTASSFAANPPKTTECTAPRRAQASIATTASGTIGM